jgi:hypothetical protein
MLLVLENHSYIIRVITLKNKKYSYLTEERIYIFYYSKNTSREKFAKLYAKI